MLRDAHSASRRPVWFSAAGATRIASLSTT